MMAVRVELEFHVLDIDSGLWCPYCLLPSAVGVTIAVVDARTLRVVGRYTAVRCFDCDRELPEAEAS